MGLSRGDIMFRMNSDIRVVTFVGKEWGDSSGGVRSIVVCKFSNG